jgi:hypothetical protein
MRLAGPLTRAGDVFRSWVAISRSQVLVRISRYRQQQMSKLRSLVGELRRRRVFRVLAAYLAAAFVVLQAADLLIEPLRA